MRRVQRNALMATLLLTIIAAGLPLWAEQPAPLPATPAQITCPIREVVLPLEDLRTIPQDVTPLAKAWTNTLDDAEQQQMHQQFQKLYFAPWKGSEPRFSSELLRERYRHLVEGTWYGENRQPVAPERLRHLLDLTDWDRFPTLFRPAVAIKPAMVRILPTIRPLYEAPDDFPFDHLQFAELKPQEALTILHTSKDGAWLYIETASLSGWVEPDAVAVVDKDIVQRLTEAQQLVIVRDFARVQTDEGRVLAQAKLGTLYPLLADEGDRWLVEAAIAEPNQQARLIKARIAKEDGSRHPLPFSPENLTLIGNELLKTPYGWGEVFRNRDCSATTRDFFLAFGLWLPRNSHQQINAWPPLSLTGLSPDDKERIIREQALPFRTLLYLPGHILLYVGSPDNKPLALHTAWGLRYTTPDGPENKCIIGRTIVSSLQLGKELSLSKGTLLERLEGMLVLPQREEARGEQPPATVQESSTTPR